MLFIAEPKSASTSLHVLLASNMDAEGQDPCQARTISSSIGGGLRSLKNLLKSQGKSPESWPQYLPKVDTNAPAYRVLFPHGMRNERLELLRLIAKTKDLVKLHLPPTASNIKALKTLNIKYCVIIREPEAAFRSHTRHLERYSTAYLSTERYPQAQKAFKDYYLGWQKLKSDPSALIIDFDELIKGGQATDKIIRRIFQHYNYKKAANAKTIYELPKNNQSNNFNKRITS